MVAAMFGLGREGEHTIVKVREDEKIALKRRGGRSFFVFLYHRVSRTSLKACRILRRLSSAVFTRTEQETLSTVLR
jgi:hypothetical protein